MPESITTADFEAFSGMLDARRAAIARGMDGQDLSALERSGIADLSDRVLVTLEELAMTGSIPTLSEETIQTVAEELTRRIAELPLLVRVLAAHEADSQISDFEPPTDSIVGTAVNDAIERLLPYMPEHLR